MLALARWDGPYSSTAFSLAKEFSKSHRVFYIDNPITVKYFLTNVRTPQIKSRLRPLFTGRAKYKNLDTSSSQLVAVTPMLTLPINFLPRGCLYDFLSSINDRILSKTINAIIQDYRINDFLFINCFNPFYLRKFPSKFKPKLFIYISVDNISHSSHVQKHGPWLEEEIVKRAGLTFTTSSELTSLMSNYSKRVFHLPNAADISLFKLSLDYSLPKPKEISEVINPIVIYTGNIDHRIDFELLKYIFSVNKDVTFVMVGPISIMNSLYEEIKAFSNVIFTGKKDISELPGFLHYASCAIIPFKCNTLTRSIYPLKINEYLAAGMPVVSTPFSKDIIEFGDVISISETEDVFAKAITDSIKYDSNEEKMNRLKFVEKNTWESRVVLFWEIVKKFMN